MTKINRDSILNATRQAVAGIAKDFAGQKTLVLDGTTTKTTDAVTTLEAVAPAIDAAVAAEAAFHGAVAAQNAAIAAAKVVLADLKVLATNRFGKNGAELGDLGFVTTNPRTPSEATKALAVQKRAATRVARGTKGPRQRAAIVGTVPAAPPVPPKS